MRKSCVAGSASDGGGAGSAGHGAPAKASLSSAALDAGHHLQFFILSCFGLPSCPAPPPAWISEPKLLSRSGATALFRFSHALLSVKLPNWRRDVSRGARVCRVAFEFRDAGCCKTLTRAWV